MSTRASARRRWAGNRATISARPCILRHRAPDRARLHRYVRGAPRVAPTRDARRRGRLADVRLAPISVALALLLFSPAAEARRSRGPARREATRARILLGGEWAQVRWTDGDTFRVLDGPQ